MQFRRNTDIELTFIFLLRRFSEFTAHLKIVINRLMKHRFQFLHRRAVKGKRVIDSKCFTDEKITRIGKNSLRFCLLIACE